MPTRLKAEFDTYKGSRYTIYVDDSAFVGTETEVKLSAGGFSLDYEGQTRDRLWPVLGSRLSFGIEVLNDYRSAVESFITDVAAAAERRFSVKVTRTSVSEVLFWCGYLLPDIARMADAEPYAFEVTATDGLGILKEIDYSDTGGVPYGEVSAVQHMVNCLNKTGLPALYFDTSDIFLRTVVSWENAGLSAANANKCPAAHTRWRGDVFAERQDGGTELYKFKSCYEVLEQIGREWCARLYFSDGAFRFEQVNARAASTFPERRFSRTGAFLTGTLSTSAERLVTQATARYRLSGGMYEFLPALNRVKIEYDHRTLRNYLEGSSFKWKNGGINDPTQIDGVGFDADSYLQLNCTISLDVTGPTDRPWVQFFYVYLRVGNYHLKRNVAISSYPPIPKPEAAQWLFTTGEYSTYTDWIYTGSFVGEIAVNIYTPLIPSGATGLYVDFEPAGGVDRDGNNAFSTVNAWAVKDAVLQVWGVEADSNYETKRTYYANNPTTGNSADVENVHTFGSAVKPWTPTRLKVSADGTTWADADNTWRAAGEANAFEWGDHVAREILRGQMTPVRVFQGSVSGDMMAHHRLTTTENDWAWLWMSGTFEAAMETLRGTWWNCAVNTINGIVLTPSDKLKPRKPRRDTGVDNMPEKVVNTSPGGRPMVPLDTTKDLAAVILAANDTSAAHSAGSVSALAVSNPTRAGAYKPGDEIVLVNPQTGVFDTLSITAESGEGDTSLYVSGTLSAAYPPGSMVYFSTLNRMTTSGGSGSGRWYRYTGTVNSSAEIVLSAGVLPSRDEDIFVTVENNAYDTTTGFPTYTVNRGANKIVFSEAFLNGLNFAVRIWR